MIMILFSELDTLDVYVNGDKQDVEVSSSAFFQIKSLICCLFNNLEPDP